MLFARKTGGYHGYWQQAEGTACFKGADTGRAGGPFRAFQGIYLPAGAQLNIPLYHHPYGHPAVPWN